MTADFENLKGTVERITYHNEENGYSVLKIKSKQHKDLITLVGNTAKISTGELIDANGKWVQHKEFGMQFSANSIQTLTPTTLEGIEKYLASGMIKGVGPHYAGLLVKAFGMEIFEVLDNNPEKLKNIRGIGPAKRNQIAEAWTKQKAIRDIMVFLQSHGVGTAKAVRIYKKYGEKAVERVKENPYQLAKDINGIGFKSADQIATNMGVAKDSILRARAGLHHVLFECLSQGHCAYPLEELLNKASELLEIDPEKLREAASLEINANDLIPETIDETYCVSLRRFYELECELASRLVQFSKTEIPWGKVETEKALPWAEQKLGITLHELQKTAVLKALTSKGLIITGGPGTGKTTLTKAILTILAAKNLNILLCSPTGRAAKRLSECTGREAKTIHRLLGVDRTNGGFLHHEENTLPADLVLVDEASMIDLPLFTSLMRALPKRAVLIIVGDVDQLPSVGPGAVLNSLIESEVFPVVKLTQIFRQALTSEIITNAHIINQGEIPSLEKRAKESDFHFVESDSAEMTSKKIIDLVKNRIPNHLKIDPVKDIQVLTPMNRGGLGSRALNMDLQRAFNPNPPAKVERYGTIYGVGDKIMVTENDYDKEVFNGDMGFIEEINMEDQFIEVSIDGRLINFDFSEMDILSLAYATTIHKSQGSEYPAIVIPIAMQHFMMLKRNLLYTGVTRGKKMVVIVGEKKAIAMAIQNKNQGKRWNKLAPRIQSLSLA